MADQLCVICGAPAGRLCSYPCLAAAGRERQENLARLRRLAGDPAASDQRNELSLRNGQITGALLDWRPHGSGFVVA